MEREVRKRGVVRGRHAATPSLSERKDKKETGHTDRERESER